MILLLKVLIMGFIKIYIKQYLKNVLYISSPLVVQLKLMVMY